jgi:hypothetical protein
MNETNNGQVPDVEKVEPTDEYKKLCTEAKKDLREVGVPFKY